MTVKLTLLVAVIGLLAWARKATPAGNKVGDAFIGNVDQAYLPHALTVASFNIQTGKSNDGKRDIFAAAQVLQNVDIAGVQEVYAPSLMNLIGIGQPQTQSLAKLGGFAWLFCATRRRWFREHRGNAILSKIKVIEWRTQMLPDQSGKSYRNMTIAKMEWNGHSFHFINTHLHTKQGRAEQLDVIMREFAQYPRAILVGDFNCNRSMPELNDALKNIEITDALEVAGVDTDNNNRIDWILTKGFNVEGARMLPKGVSDHPYYEVKLSYKL